jgi:hypothetical protein
MVQPEPKPQLSTPPPLSIRHTLIAAELRPQAQLLADNYQPRLQLNLLPERPDGTYTLCGPQTHRHRKAPTTRNELNPPTMSLG